MNRCRDLSNGGSQPRQGSRSTDDAKGEGSTHNVSGVKNRLPTLRRIIDQHRGCGVNRRESGRARCVAAVYASLRRLRRLEACRAQAVSTYPVGVTGSLVSFASHAGPTTAPFRTHTVIEDIQSSTAVGTLRTHHVKRQTNFDALFRRPVWRVARLGSYLLTANDRKATRITVKRWQP